jgi:hypothetical protein
MTKSIKLDPRKLLGNDGRGVSMAGAVKPAGSIKPTNPGH